MFDYIHLMFEILAFVFYVILMAIISTILFLLLKWVSSPLIKIVLPLVFGVIIAYIVIPNPQPDEPLLWQLMLIGTPLLIPCFIVAVVSLIEKKDGITFNKLLIFFGSLISAIFLFLIQVFGLSTAIPALLRLPFIVIFSLIGSFLVFYGISHISFFHLWSHEQIRMDTGASNQVVSWATDKKKIIILAVVLILLCSPFFLLDFISRSHTHYGQLSISLQDYSKAPKGTVIHLTEEQFREYPQLESLIKYPETGFGIERISCEKESQMKNEGLISTSRSSPAVYLEYDGKLYTLGIDHYAGEECRT